jgi:5'-deoxynucleotidase YfbR-like HD superfamily hydrolase
MLSGRRLDLLAPKARDIAIADIAHGLARVARWNGQTHGRHIFSVAQHTLLVEALLLARHPGADAQLRLATLLHDAPEYVIGDLITPFKSTIGRSYKAVELRLLGAIHRRYGLPAELSAAHAAPIKAADTAAAHLEAVRLAGFGAAEARRLFGARPELSDRDQTRLLTPWPAATAERRFLARFEALAPP